MRRGTVVNVIRALRRDLDVGLGALAAVAWCRRAGAPAPRRPPCVHVRVAYSLTKIFYSTSSPRDSFMPILTGHTQPILHSMIHSYCCGSLSSRSFAALTLRIISTTSGRHAHTRLRLRVTVRELIAPARRRSLGEVAVHVVPEASVAAEAPH